MSEETMCEPLNILVIEDRTADFLMVERHLKQNGLSVRCSRVDSLEGLKEAIDRESWDLVLADYNVPQLDFLESLNLMLAALPDVPVIMVTGTVGEEKAVDLLKVGVRDFVLKDNLSRLVPAVLRSLKEKRELEERRLAEKLLRESEEMYRSLFENMMNGFAYCRMFFDGDTPLDFIYLSVNDAFEKQTGLKDVVGRRVSEVIPGIRESDPGLFEVYGRVAMTGNPEQFETYVEALEQWYWISVYSPAREHFVAVFDVITKRKQAEEKLQKKNAEIEQLIFTVSHDLRSPLVTVKTFMGYLEIDMAGNNQEQIDQDIKFIHSAADKMKLLLDELLEMSRIGRVETPQVSVLLRDVLDEVLGDLAGVISERKVDIHPPDTDLMLFVDRPRLCKVWQNLIENAIKFCSDDSIPRIDLGVQQVSGETVFFVKDNGIGIAPEYHTKIFGIFEKVNPKSPGAGLGLSMIQRIVEKCGGRVWVESDGAGKGSCFRFTLPGAVLSEMGE
jgi:PAS domain S-box-containing protein